MTTTQCSEGLGERAPAAFMGRSSLIEFNRAYPEGGSIKVLRIISDGRSAVSEVQVRAHALTASRST
jgi:hypothetical protein